MSNALQRKKLSKQNLEALQDYLTSLSYPDTISEWISLTSTMTGPDSAGAVSKKRKLADMPSNIASSRGLKHTRGYETTLHEVGVMQSNSPGRIPPVSGETEIHEYFSTPIEIPSLASSIDDWFKQAVPSEASLVNFVCDNIFPRKRPVPGKKHVVIHFEFRGPFKEHDERVLYPIVKQHKGSKLFETPDAKSLTVRSDFVFAALFKWFDPPIREEIERYHIVKKSVLPGFSNNNSSFAVAIVAEAKITSSEASFLAAQNQWSIMAYTQLMQRISITREETYVGDENICQYGYLICGLQIKIWKMSLVLNHRRRASDILDGAYNFPVEFVGNFELADGEDLERFIATHDKILRWWFYGYLRTYINDVTKIITAYPNEPAKWVTPWQEAVAKGGCLVNHLPYFLLTLAQIWESSQPTRTTYMAMVSIQYIHDEIIGLFAIFFADTCTDIEEQPASKDVGGDGKYTVYPR